MSFIQSTELFLTHISNLELKKGDFFINNANRNGVRYFQLQRHISPGKLYACFGSGSVFKGVEKYYMPEYTLFVRNILGLLKQK